MIAGIEFLKIKDCYHPDRLTPSVLWLITAFMVTAITAAFLILNGIKVHRLPRLVTRKKVTSRPKEISTNAANTHGVTVATASAQRI